MRKFIAACVLVCASVVSASAEDGIMDTPGYTQQNPVISIVLTVLSLP